MPTNESRNIELYESSTPFLDVYPDYSKLKLPKWVLENIDNARVYGYQNKGIILQDGRKYHLNNKLNDLSGKEWTLFINSVFTTYFPTKGKEGYAHHIRKIHPTPKPPQLMKELIEFFTKESEMVFDCFAGVGGTLIGASLANRKAAGIELNPTYIEAYGKVCDELSLLSQPIIQGDSLELLKKPETINNLLSGNEISLMLIDPPYSNMMSREKTGGDIGVYGNVSTPFTNEDCDLGNMEKDQFLESLKTTVELTIPYMKKEAYIVIFIKDLQPSKKEVNLLHADVINKINEIPKVYYKGMKIWADGSTKLYPYGYPFSFVANQIHQYIMVFRKEKK